MKIVFTGIALTVFGFVLFQSCTYDKEIRIPLPNCPDTLNVSFTVIVRPILQVHCFSCHGNGANDGNISLETYDQVKQVAISGRLLGAISHSPGFAEMPQGAPKLSDCNIMKVRTWIQKGTQNN